MPFNPYYNIENPQLVAYEYAWVNFIKNDVIPYELIPDEIIESWIRCKQSGLDPLGLQQKEIKKKKASSDNVFLLEAAKNVMQPVLEVFEKEELSIHVLNTNREVLLSLGSKELNSHAGFRQSDGSELVIGTNSADMALRHKKPISIIGAQHYCERFHKYACYASPIEVNGEIVGVVSMSVMCENMNSAMLAVVTTATHNIAGELALIIKNNQISKKDQEKSVLLDSVSDGIVYIDSRREITFANDRIGKLLGIESSKLIGMHLADFPANPSLNLLNMSAGNPINARVTLKGVEENYTCFVSRKTVNATEEEDANTLLLFRVIDEIQDLANIANSSNSAYYTFEKIIGDSPCMRDTIDMAMRVSDYDARIILEGESGTGKEMLAQSIHNASKRRKFPFIALDCGAIPRELIESELFGYEEGAFTGARKGGSRGKFEMANKGTLFLDEIENLPLDMQSKLLRVLQQKTVVRVGGSRERPFDVQIIAATNMDLKEEIKKGAFREDLYYRLNVIHITIPPLRERKEDIPLLVDHYIRSGNVTFHKNVKGIDARAMDRLMNFSWPGNVRQLNNIVERMLILTDESIIPEKAVPSDISGREMPGASVMSQKVAEENFEIKTLDELERDYIKKVLVSFEGNVKKTSEALGISRSTIYRHTDVSKGGVGR